MRGPRFAEHFQKGSAHVLSNKLEVIAHIVVKLWRAQGDALFGVSPGKGQPWSGRVLAQVALAKYLVPLSAGILGKVPLAVQSLRLRDPILLELP